MAKVILRYPDGSQGVALLLLRLSLAVIAFPSLARSWPASANWWPVAIPAAALGLALAAGFGTRAAALLLTATLVAGLVSAEAALAPFLAVSSGSAASLALLGPGAYSIDAHRFGRRVIRVDAASPKRGSGG